MKRFILDDEDKNLISNKEHNHLKNVMRLKVGDLIIGTRFNEYDYLCKIKEINKNNTIVDIIDKVKNEQNPKRSVTVFQAFTKIDNMNLIVQKLTEIGVSNLIPFLSKFITAKDKLGKKDKLQEISNQSIKQCGRSIPLKVFDGVSFNKMCEMLKSYDLVIFANEKEKMPISSLFEKFNIIDNVAIIIGSEGGFSEDEVIKLIDSGAKSVSLGKRILRSETASIVVSSIVLYFLGELA